jgi:ActR/RegA family two-component response regulator
VARLLHELRSTLARLKGEIELMDVPDEVARGRVLESVADALRALESVEDAHRAITRPYVFVIDDDERLAGATAKQLHRLGFGAQALRSLADIPDPADSTARAVVDLSVLRLARRDQRERLQRYKPIVVSGSSDPAAKREAISYGAAAYLVKPVDLNVLFDTLSRRV